MAYVLPQMGAILKMLEILHSLLNFSSPVQSKPPCRVLSYVAIFDPVIHLGLHTKRVALVGGRRSQARKRSENIKYRLVRNVMLQYPN